MKAAIFGALLVLAVAFPAVTASAVGVIGAIAVAAAGQPAVVAFTAGIVVGPRMARTVRGWTA